MARNWSLAVVWTLATAGALVMTTLVIELLVFPLLGLFLLPLVPFAGVVPGFPVGALQWLVLRRVVPDTGYWVLVTGSAFGVAWLLTLVLGFYVMSGALLIVACAFGAAVIGCAQAALLRRWTSRARMWVPVSIAGWTAAAAVLLYGPRTVPGVSGPADRLVSWAAGFDTQSALGTALLGGLMAGGITGIALPWILERTITFEIRRAGLADVDEIAAAHLDSIHSIGAHYYEPRIVSDWAARVQGDLYAEAMARGELFFIAIGERGGKREVLGFSSHRIDVDEHRTAVYVRGTATRLGIGSALFRTAEAAAIAAGATSLHVDASQAAVEFYTANGFEEVGRGAHRLWSGRPMACVFMRKNLA